MIRNREIEKKEDESSAAVRLEAHMEGNSALFAMKNKMTSTETRKTTKIEVVHVSQVLPGGSCVPSREKKVFWLEEKNKELNMM